MTPQNIRFGIIGGILIVFANLALYFYSPKFMMNYTWYFGYVIYLLTLFLANRKNREELGGAMTIKEGFVNAWKVFVLISLFEVVFVYILWNFINPDLPNLAREVYIENAKWYCETAEINPCLKLQDAQKTDPKEFIINFVGSLKIYFSGLIAPGAIFSFLVALITRREEI